MLPADVYLPERYRRLTCQLSQASLAGAALLVLATFPETRVTTFEGGFVADPMAAVLQAAAVGSRPRELHAGAGRDGVIPPPEGSLVGDWTEARQRQLMELIGLWVRVMPQAAAERRLAEIEGERSRLRFAWYGPTDGSDPIYYRIQGPTLIIEFSATGDHYHSIYRNPTNEYGGA